MKNFQYLQSPQKKKCQKLQSSPQLLTALQGLPQSQEEQEVSQQKLPTLSYTNNNNSTITDVCAHSTGANTLAFYSLPYLGQESHSTDDLHKHRQLPPIFGTQTTTATSTILSPPLLPLSLTTSATISYQYKSTSSQQQQSQLQSPLQPFTTTSSPLRSPSRNKCHQQHHCQLHQYNSNFNQITISSISAPTFNCTPQIAATSTTTNMSKGGYANYINKQKYEEKRAMRLERNRVAAKECRERKKAYILNLESKATRLEQENANLRRMVKEMKSKLDWAEIKTAENVQLQLLVQDLKCHINEMQKCSINGNGGNNSNNIDSSNGLWRNGISRGNAN